MKLNKWSIKWQLFSYLAVFIGFLLIILWLFQVVFLESFYKTIKLNEIRESGTRIAKNIDSQNLELLLENVSETKEMCIMITDETGHIVYSIDTLPNCTIHRMTSNEYLHFIKKALSNDGTDLQYINYNIVDDIRPQIKYYTKQLPKLIRKELESVIYTQIIQKKDGSIYVLFLNATISPVKATVQTIRTQLFYVTLIMLFLAFLLALFISKKISKPIIKMNTSAKQLATGNYDSSFEGKGYKEIAELSQSLNYAATELSKTDTFRRELIANVSHDLRTPLTLIAGYAEVMRDLPGENTPENTQVIIDEAHRLTQLVNDMLDLSQLQADTQDLHLTKFNLTSTTKKILARYTRLCEQEGYTTHFLYDQEVWVSADELKLSQVLYNLINNAINYTGEDKGITVRQTTTTSKVKIKVIDTGIGIAQENLPYIWDRYYKIGTSHKRASIGTGLGLSIVRSILERHGAHYGVNSTPHTGSEFWFELPLESKPN